MNLKNKTGVPKSSGYDPECLAAGIKDETKEHPWLSKSQVERLVKDHLDIDPEYYESEEEDEEDKEESED